MVITADAPADHYGVAVLQDAQGAFAAAYGGAGAAWLVRPDGYIAWRGPSPDHAGLRDILLRVFGMPRAV